MKNYKIALPLFVITLICSGLFTSCSNDNPITSTSKLSPPRYSWTVDTLVGFGNDIVPFDTNSYYILTYADLLNKNMNGIQTSYSLDFLGTSMDGDGENNLMIGGAIEYSSENYFPVLKKFNNGALTEIYRGSTYSINYYFSCVSLIDFAFWCGTTKGEIVSYNNGVVNYFVIDTTYRVQFISKDRNNNINAVLYKNKNDTNGFPFISSFKVFTLNSGLWQLTYQKDVDSGFFALYPGVKDKIFSFRGDNENQGTYDFAGGIFSKILDENTTGAKCYFAGGKSMNDLIILGKDVNSTSTNNSIFHWNGLSASAEVVSNFDMLENRILKVINKYEKNYLLFFNSYSETYYLLRSTKLKN